jgi:hypothetical protein
MKHLIVLGTGTGGAMALSTALAEVSTPGE